MSQRNCRFATSADARRILEIHYSAVHETAAVDYPEEIIGDWSPPVTRERVNEYLKELSSPHNITLVMEIDGEVAGYGTVVAPSSVLQDLYVAAAWDGQRVGSTLLLELERIARQRGLKELRLNATLTGHGFYQRYGYNDVGPGEYTLSSGRKMAHVKMQKQLP